MTSESKITSVFDLEESTSNASNPPPRLITTSASLQKQTSGGAANLPTNEKEVNLTNVSKLTTFQLRQQLVKRGSLDIEESKINHNSMLQRLIKDLIEEEANEVQHHTAVLEDSAQVARDAAKALREEKKREAMERSKQRQSDPAYFERIRELNKKPEVDTETAGARGAALSEGDDTGEAEEVDCNAKEAEDDPFRSYHSKSRSKIHVR